MQMSEVVRWRIRHVGGTGDDLSTPPSSSSSSGAVGETSLVCRVGNLGRSGAFSVALLLSGAFPTPH